MWFLSVVIESLLIMTYVDCYLLLLQRRYFTFCSYFDVGFCNVGGLLSVVIVT